MSQGHCGWESRQGPFPLKVSPKSLCSGTPSMLGVLRRPQQLAREAGWPCPRLPGHSLWGTFISISRDTKAQKEGPSPRGTPRSSLILGRMTGKMIGPAVEFALPTIHVALPETDSSLSPRLPSHRHPALTQSAHSPLFLFRELALGFESHLYCHLFILHRPSRSPPLKGPVLQVWSPPHGTLGTVVHGCGLHCLTPCPPPLTVIWILALALT